MDRLESDWFSFMLDQLGKEKGLSLMRRLSANDLIYRRGATLNLQLVAAGEAPLGFPLKGHRVEEMKQLGAPVDWNRPEPVFFSQSGVGISSKPPHPDTAKLFVDFVLSQAGQDNLAKAGRTPTRPGVKHMVPSLTEGIVFPKIKLHSTEEFGEIVKLFNETFKVRR